MSDKSPLYKPTTAAPAVDPVSRLIIEHQSCVTGARSAPSAGLDIEVAAKLWAEAEKLRQQLGNIKPTSIREAAALLSYAAKVEQGHVAERSPLLKAIDNIVAMPSKLENAPEAMKGADVTAKRTPIDRLWRIRGLGLSLRDTGGSLKESHPESDLWIAITETTGAICDEAADAIDELQR